MSDVLKAYEIAKKQYAKIGVDTDKVIENLKKNFWFLAIFAVGTYCSSKILLIREGHSAI